MVHDTTSDGRAEVFLNRPGTGCLIAPQGIDFDGHNVLRWSNGLLGDPADWVRTVERHAGLEPPSRGLPPSTPRSLVLRTIAAFLAAAAGSRERWTAVTGIGMDGLRHDLLQAIPDVHAHWRGGGGDGAAATRLWMICPTMGGTSEDRGAIGQPALAFSDRGHVWTASGRSEAIVHLYRHHHRRLHALITDIAGDLLT